MMRAGGGGREDGLGSGRGQTIHHQEGEAPRDPGEWILVPQPQKQVSPHQPLVVYTRTQWSAKDEIFTQSSVCRTQVVSPGKTIMSRDSSEGHT